MSFAAAPRRPSSGGRPARRRSPIGIAIAVVGALVVLLLLLAQFWTEVLWFRQLDFANVLWTQWGARIALFVAGFLVMGGLDQSVAPTATGLRQGKGLPLLPGRRTGLREGRVKPVAAGAPGVDRGVD